MTTEEIYLDLLKRGLAFKVKEPKDFHCAHMDWKSVFKISKQQATLGIVYAGIETLDKRCLPEENSLLLWYGYVQQIEANNDLLNKRLVEVVGKYRLANLFPVLLKGQGIGAYYPNPRYRQPGDIDLFFGDQYQKANAVAATWENVQFLSDTTFHRAFFYNDIEIENHVKYVEFCSRANAKAWEKVQQMVPLVGHEKFRLENFEVNVPTPQMNVIYVFLHFMHHFLQIGVGMRQVCDWACLWNAKHKEIDQDLFLRCVDLLCIRRSMTALTFIVTTYLGLPAAYIPLDATTEQARRDGELMLRDILEMGNFGHDTAICRGFIRNHHWHNLKSYFMAFRRQLRLYRFYPSEVRAYPWAWLKAKIQGK